MDSKMSRRTLLFRGLQMPIAGSALLGMSACDSGSDRNSDKTSAMVCADTSTMTSAEESIRRALNYTETSPDPSRACAGCEFFHAAEVSRGCGTCEMFGGKAVNPGGHCDSWSVDA
ncbi:MAG: high-potential iron-sulfur protein [Chromatocurvus sp.]